MYFLFKMGIFHSYVCLPEGTSPGMILQVRDQPAFWLFLHFLCQASIAMFSWPGDTQSRWSGGFFLLSDIFGSTPKIWAQAPSRLYVWLSFTLRSLKNGWLGDDCFLCGMAKFQGLCYSFREGIQFDMFFLNCGFVVGGRESVMLIQLIHIQEKRNHLIVVFRNLVVFHGSACVNEKLVLSLTNMIADLTCTPKTDFQAYCLCMAYLRTFTNKYQRFMYTIGKYVIHGWYGYLETSSQDLWL